MTSSTVMVSELAQHVVTFAELVYVYDITMYTSHVLGKHKWRAIYPSTTRLSADRLSFFLQHLISMPIYKLNLYLNIKNWFTSVFINANL